ncbi:phosphatidylinositol 4-phosphate 5-kinase [Acrasis kona]|uniref:Phosphatidylinositol 4-phosphate 5-kinase n=1 Tax=Acrasis kona TaxID=1008807 RepID=A0AAW2ZAL1_9EUKA
MLGLADDHKILAEFLFHAFDKDSSGTISLDEFLYSTYILTKGSPEEKAKFAFSMLDSDHDGTINKYELQQMISALYKTMHDIGLGSFIEKSAVEYCNEIFKLFDHDEKGIIDMEKYSRGARLYPEILTKLGVPSLQQEGIIKNHSENELTEVDYQKSEKPALDIGSPISIGSQKWKFEMMIGVRISSSMSGHVKRHLIREDFTAKLEFELPDLRREASIMPSYSKKKKEKQFVTIFIDFSPIVFYKLRVLSFVDDTDYVMSLGPEQMLGNFLLGNLSSLTEKISDGKSGSYFFYSYDLHYLVKTIPKHEFVSFRSMLSSYFYHIEMYPDSLLNRVFGLHQLNDDVFVVINNIFWDLQNRSRRHSWNFIEIYDLKGSEYGRTNANGFIKKDLDLKDKFYLGPTWTSRILSSLKIDSDFLSSKNVLDYSLIVGVAKKPYRETDSDADVCHISRGVWRIQAKDASEKVKVFGSGNECYTLMYFVGIIDYLTEYGLRKETEIKFKSMFTDANKISAIAPSLYAKRFQNYVNTIFE